MKTSGFTERDYLAACNINGGGTGEAAEAGEVVGARWALPGPYAPRGSTTQRCDLRERPLRGGGGLFTIRHHPHLPGRGDWTERASGTSNWLNGVTYGNGLFVAVGEDGTILTSPDGVTWTQRTSGTRATGSTA
jgi:hypothetical protein